MFTWPRPIVGLMLAVLSLPAAGQSGWVSSVDRYPEEEVSSGYWGESNVLPGAYQQYLQTPQSLGGLWALGPRSQSIQRSSFAGDAHAGVTGYWAQRQCLDCHAGTERNMHSARTTTTCRQCHRAEPIAGVFHYYSEMNPIRRHAYVCAKCHQGATANFAAYVVHEPSPIARETRESFPALFYATWFMVILAGGVFVFFIPYVILWGIRELVAKLFGGPQHDRA